MPIKNIIVHMAPDEAHMARFEVAMTLAKQNGAHLEIAYMASPASMPAAIQGRGASAAYIAEATAIAREKAEGVHDEIVAVCEPAGVPWTWEVLEGDHNALLAERSYYADLLVVTESHGALSVGHVGLHEIEELVIAAACAVLVLPGSEVPDSIGKRVLVAWKDTHEAARAVRDGMTFIRQADEVYVLTSDRPHHRFEAGADIATYLKRHGVEVKQESDVVERGDVCDVILSYADDLSADLLILGAYSRTGWLKTLVGSVTEDVLSRQKLPVLLSH